MADWHGWAVDDTAVFIAPVGEQDPRPALWQQVEREVDIIGLFRDEPAARWFQQWMDGTLGAQAQVIQQLSAPPAL